jgi:alkylation response protein AidB-like acyl-CoA dehydrogenase
VSGAVYSVGVNCKGTDTTAVAQLKSKSPQSPPVPNGDFYEVTESLNDSERAILKKVRAFMETNVAPVITKYWAEDAFPFELLPGLRDLNIATLGYQGYGCSGGSTLLMGFIMMEIAREAMASATALDRSWGYSSLSDRAC